jgi:type IV pilus assembly protein PilQ
MKNKRIWFLGFMLLISTKIMANNQNISLSFNDTPVREVLNWLTQYSDTNIIVSQAVQENMSISLKNVTWQQALAAVLKSQGLAEKKVGKVLYVASIDEMAKRRKQEQDLLIKLPLKTKLIKMKYAKAQDIAKLLKGKNKKTLSQNGRVMTDDRTNSLIIRDHESKLKEISFFVRKLDVQAPQVLIEARIVNMDKDYEKELGVRFGLTGGKHISGTLKAANKLAGGTAPSQVNPLERLNVDLPAVATNAAHFGMALFKLANGTFVDLELSALESEGHAEITSNPRLLTANQQTATIESGEEIPYQQAVAEGVTATEFKKAVLSLQVTPQITPNHKIILELKVNQDKRSSMEVKGVPAINTRQIHTRVLVDDGQTVVLGGIYEHMKTDGVRKVPWLGDLPFVGALFRYKKEINNHRESLIFVTPKII